MADFAMAVTADYWYIFIFYILSYSIRIKNKGPRWSLAFWDMFYDFSLEKKDANWFGILVKWVDSYSSDMPDFSLYGEFLCYV